MSYRRIDLWNDANDFKNSEKWRCYLGKTTYDANAAGADAHLGKDWYLHEDNKNDLDKFFKDRSIWTFDVNGGFNNHTRACKHLNQSIVRGSSGEIIFRTVKTKPHPDDWDTRNKWNFYLASPRVESVKYYNGGLFIIDVNKLPSGCGSWPTFKLVGTPESWSTNSSSYKFTWPDNGEVDIIEQVNGEKKNHTTLHTTGGCTVQRKSYCNSFTSTGTHDNCEWGCAVDMKEGTGGQDVDGFYVCEWEPDKHMKFWYIPRDGAPDALKTNSQNLNLSLLGNPHTEHIFNDGCNGKFTNMHLVISTILCGERASKNKGDKCSDSWTRPNTCNAFLKEKFKNPIVPFEYDDYLETHKYSWNSSTSTETSRQLYLDLAEQKKNYGDKINSVRDFSGAIIHDSYSIPVHGNYYWSINSVSVYEKLEGTSPSCPTTPPSSSTTTTPPTSSTTTPPTSSTTTPPSSSTTTPPTSSTTTPPSSSTTTPPSSSTTTTPPTSSTTTTPQSNQSTSDKPPTSDERSEVASFEKYVKRLFDSITKFDTNSYLYIIIAVLFLFLLITILS